jgi:Ca2+-binding RTX toxin-like protein
MHRSILAFWQARKVTSLIALTAVLLALFAAPALAVLITGTGGDDTLTGTQGSDTIRGRAGDDTVSGGGGGDGLAGGKGNDTLNGEGGTDVLYGQEDNDRLFGGPGDDRLAGNAGDDLLVGEDGRTDEFYGGAGFDTCVVEGPEHAKSHNINGCEEIENGK